MNIRRRIGLSMTLLALIVVIFVGLFSNYIAKDTLKNRGKEFLMSILIRTSYEINQQLNSMEKVTNFIYDDFELTFNYSRASDVVYVEKYLEKFESTIKLAAELSPSKSAFLILNIDEKQHIIWYRDYNKDGIPEQYNTLVPEERFNFKMPEENVLLWINDKSLSNEITSVKHHKNNNVSAYVGTDLNYSLLKNKLDTSKYLNSGILFITDSDGAIIYHPNVNETFLDMSIFNNTVFESVETQDSNGVPVVLTKSVLSNHWLLIISAETSDIFLGLNRINYVILIILLVAFLIAAMYSIMVSKRIAGPYLYLTKKIEEIGNGNYDVVFDDAYVSRTDEVGSFTNALITTVKRQKDSFEEIKNYNLNLEELIEERTKELIKTNEALEESVITTEEKQEILEVTNKQLEVSIDEIKKTRKQLINSEKIASSRYMAIGIAHNLNTPIGSAKSIASFIVSRTEKISERLNDNYLTKNQLLEFLTETKSGGQKILESINDSIQLIEKMKALSVIKTVEHVSLVNVEEVIKLQVENSKREHAQEVCGYTILVDANLKFRCDLYNLQKIFYELIANSYTHAFHDIEAPHITIKAYRNDTVENGIIIEYYDNGIGVDVQHKNELFTPLYTTQLSKRHGLGLTMVYNLVNERFDGEINIETFKNVGLGFYIKLYESKYDEGVIADVE